jgi:hypothetical protein
MNDERHASVHHALNGEEVHGEIVRAVTEDNHRVHNQVPPA